MKKAIVYASDIVLGRTGEVIKRSYQKELVTRYAAEKNIEIVAWFEDDMYNENIMERPGVKAMMDYKGEYDFVLVERVWAFSRSMTTLETFFKELDRRGVNFDCATVMWDCVSQKCRRRFNPALPAVRTGVMAERDGSSLLNVRKPAKVNFVPMLGNKAVK